jgi:hypothetical protein
MYDSTAERALLLANSFEAEVFVHLLLEKWKHPLSEDAEFRNDLLEGAAQALQESCDGLTLIEPLKPEDFNFIAAMWFVEWSALQASVGDLPFRSERQQWLEDIRHALLL